MKKLAAALLTLSIIFSSSVHVFAYTPAPAKDGFVAEYTIYDTLEYNGTGIMPVIRKLLSSGVTRYVNHKTGQYYAKGATLVVESTTGEHVYHTTTVRLEKDEIVLVEASESGKGEVWATTGETPTKGKPRVFWK